MSPVGMESVRLRDITKKLLIGVSGVAVAAAMSPHLASLEQPEKVFAMSASDARLLSLDTTPEFQVGDCTVRLPGSVLLGDCLIEPVTQAPLIDREDVDKMPRPEPTVAPKVTPKPRPTYQAQVNKTTSAAPPTTAPPMQAASAGRTEPNDATFDRLAQCEAGGRWDLNTGNGYYGGLQFSASTWRGVGGSGLPSEHSRREQIDRAKILQQRSGWRHNWPSCSRQLGLRD